MPILEIRRCYNNLLSLHRWYDRPAISNDWIEHCTGYIAAEVATKANSIDNSREAEEDARMWQDALKTVSQTCQSPLDMVRGYENLWNVGLNFGPLFKNLSNVKLGQGGREATGVATTPDVAGSMPKGFMYPHVHPCTLDSMLQVSLMSILDDIGGEMLPVAMLPTFLREVWVASAVSSSAGHTFRGHSKSTPVAAQGYESDVMVWDGEVDEGSVD